MNNTTRLIAIIAALVLTIAVAIFGVNILRSSNAQDNLGTALEEITTATTEKELQQALEKAEKAVKQGAKIEEKPQIWIPNKTKIEEF